MKEENRYDNVPISDETRKGMTLTSDDIHAISRLLMLQDRVYDDEFEDIKASIQKQSIAFTEFRREIRAQLRSLTAIVQNHEERILKLEECFTKKSA